MKPPTIAPDYNSLPGELRVLPIWLMWDYRFVKGKWTKFPYGSSTDPQTWNHLDKLRNRRADGIGFAFAYGYCGIDLDCCRNRETGEIKPWARELVERFNTYTEVSPSGEGLHIILHLADDLKVDGVKRGGKDAGWEIGFYPVGRYFCATGKVLEQYDTIQEVDVDSISRFRDELRSGKLDVIPSSKPKPVQASTASVGPTGDNKFERLMSGKWEGLGYGSQSEADFGLCSFLARSANGNAAIIDRMFRASGMMRDKWDESRPSGTYGSVTIEKVLAEQPQVVSVGELTRKDMPEAVLDGRLGEIYQRHMKGAALAYAWGPLLTVAGASPFLKYQGQAIRGNLYYCSVGDPGTGKSAIYERALHILGMDALTSILLRAKYGSAEGLVSDLNDAGSCVRLLAPDELSHLLRKCAIEHSSFPTFLTTAFYEDRQRGGTKKDAWEIDCRLSIMGGVVEADFQDVFGFASVSGLYDRFLFGLAPRPYSYEYYPHEGTAQRISPVPPKVEPDVWEVRNEWLKEGISGRVAEICLRAAWICAAVDGRPTLRGCDLGSAHALAKYQMQVREFLKPNPGQNADAKSAISIMNWLREHAASGEWVRRYELSRGIHSYRLGPGVFNRALQNLQYNDELELDLQRKLVRLVRIGAIFGAEHI